MDTAIVFLLFWWLIPGFPFDFLKVFIFWGSVISQVSWGSVEYAWSLNLRTGSEWLLSFYFSKGFFS